MPGMGVDYSTHASPGQSAEHGRDDAPPTPTWILLCACTTRHVHARGRHAARGSWACCRPQGMQAVSAGMHAACVHGSLPCRSAVAHMQPANLHQPAPHGVAMTPREHVLRL